MGTKMLKIKLYFLYYILFSTSACFYPFITLYFQSRNIPYYKIGFLFAINSFVSIICQPIWGIISDRYLGKRKTIFFIMISSAISIISFIFIKSFEMILISIIIFMAFQSPIVPISDAYCYEIIDKNKAIQYGKIRLMGSMGYAVTALILGIVIKKSSIESTFISYTIIMICTIFMLKSINFKSKQAGVPININDISKIIKNKKFILISLAGMFASVAMGANSSYISVLIQKTGGDVSKLGLVWFVIAMSELPLFYIGNKIMKKIGILNFFIIGTTFFVIRFFINSICTSYKTVILVQLMQSITFPLYLLSTIEYVIKNSDSNMKTSALTVFSAFTNGLGGLLGNILGGYILQLSSVFVLYKVLSLSCIISTVVALLLKSYERIKIS
ncbi:MFS transporter [Caloramator sp. E03]|uniref:MFS transporter n=1 Tax=Caloramator sp. E03 TaxID=2576307 RepID=UPI00143E0523|nr:MFS transporter [Caloramator sp. E03]